jgi:hypothetical protein
MKPQAAVVLGLIALSTGSVSPALAFDYARTPLSKAVAAHDLILVGTVRERAGGRARVEPVAAIKGRPPGRMLMLPDTWRTGTEITFGPVRLEAGKTYLLMLRRDNRDDYTLSPDFAADAVAAVPSQTDPLVRAVAVLYRLSQQGTAAARKATLAQVWEEEANETKVKLSEAFAADTADEATIPFLVRAMGVGADRLGLTERSATVIQKHRYTEVVPALLRIVEKKDPGCLSAARTLAALKVKAAYEPIMALIDDSPVGNEAYFIEALGQLEDQRSVPFLIKALHRNLPGLDRATGARRSWSMRENEFAATALGRLRAPEAVEPLAQLLALDGYTELRSLAVTALGEIGPPARPAVSKIRQHLREGRIRDDIAKAALIKIEGGK